MLEITTVPGIPYNVSVAAVNQAGQGEFSVIIHFTQQLGIDLFSVLLNKLRHPQFNRTMYFPQQCVCHSTLCYCHGGVVDSPELL
jgi:hypothetical protein